MSPERWQRVTDVFAAALDQDPPERPAYVQSACGNDADLRAEVESLLAESDEAKSFLNRPAARLLGPQRPPAPVPSQIGRYHVVGTLGKGGMGTVYSAWDPVIGRLVAIKVININDSDSDEWQQYRRRFHREAQIAGRLLHSSIVMLFDVGQQDDQPYLVMEFVPGKSLATHFKEGQPIQPVTALPWLWDAAGALDYAHSCDVVHRDIKPANLLLHDSGQIKVTDFGIAKFMSVDSHTTAGMFVGTLGYVAPEVGRTDALSGRADQYSLAVLAYRMLTGRLPHEIRTVAAFSEYIGNGQASPASQVNNALRRDVDPVLTRALSKEPSKRFPSCVSFVGALRSALRL